MKRLLLLSALMISLTIRLSGNVIYPQAYIEEFYIDPSGNWMLELSFYDHPDSLSIDSIYIETLSGSSRLATYTVFQSVEGYGYMTVIMNDNLEKPVEIEPDSDLLIVISYLDYSDFNQDQLPLGKYKGSRFPYIPEKHSITLIYDYIGWLDDYALDNTPTIGERNTNEGTEGTVSGYLFDTDHNPLPNTIVYGFMQNLFTDETGFYCGNVLARLYEFDTTFEFPFDGDYIYEPASLFVLPDSSYILDLVLLGILTYTGTTELPATDLMITNYPNPFTDETTFYIAIPAEIHFSRASLEIIDNAGKPVYSIPLKEHLSKVTLPDGDRVLKPGVYHYFLNLDGITPMRTYSFIKI